MNRMQSLMQPGSFFNSGSGFMSNMMGMFMSNCCCSMLSGMGMGMGMRGFGGGFGGGFGRFGW
ncbi:hypothetical protein [Roseateles chitinivorans]|uniref:hypothetical protein n=1 Tax=Roseateles chitinivorans TaxID=2917965 RepID=UPI003D67ADED